MCVCASRFSGLINCPEIFVFTQIAYIKQRRMSANKGDTSKGGLSGLGAWPNKSKKDTDSAKVGCLLFPVRCLLFCFEGWDKWKPNKSKKNTPSRPRRACCIRKSRLF